MKQLSILYTIILATFLLSPCYTSAADKGPVAWWDFDGSDNKVAIEKVSGGVFSETGQMESDFWYAWLRRLG